MTTTPSRQERLGFILQHADNPTHRGPLPEATIVAGGGGGECGESIKLYLKVDDEQRITAASFEAEGTTIGRAAASLTVETILGMTLPEVLTLQPEVIVDTFGRDIVGDRLRAATVTLDTAKTAARNYLTKIAYPLAF
jgi:nitrogen fixation protein NifU and related proteins